MKGHAIFQGKYLQTSENLKSSFTEPLRQFPPNLAKISWRRGFKFVEVERPRLFTSGDNSQTAKVHTLKKFMKNLLLNYWTNFIIHAYVIITSIKYIH